MQTLKLNLSHSTIAVFDPHVANPFNNWTDQHVKQGFSWRKESVSFSTLRDHWIAKVEVVLADEIKLAQFTERAILVPFAVQESGQVEISSIDKGEVINIPAGNYALIYETAVLSQAEEWSRLTFMPDEKAEAKILRTDHALSPDYPLLMSAEPA
jgi:Competence protein J (ComJ)